MELFNCVFVGKNFLGKFLGRLVGFERICFIQYFNKMFCLFKRDFLGRCVGFECICRVWFIFKYFCNLYVIFDLRNLVCYQAYLLCLANYCLNFVEFQKFL